MDEPPGSLRTPPVIREGYNSELDELRNITKHGKKWIAELEAKEKEATGINFLKIGYNKVFGYYLEVTKVHIYIWFQSPISASRPW